MVGKNQKTVAVGMSGGVDSSVAAFLLKKQGYNVIGVTMKIWEGEGRSQKAAKGGCYGPVEAVEAAQKVASQIGIPHHVLDLHAEYKQAVLNYFRDEYLAGRTPNPCVVCNQKIKFGLLLDKAQQSGIALDFFATGHYARIIKNGGIVTLARAKDKTKDQSYFLYGINKDVLRNLVFPLGELTKREVRSIAAQLNLYAAEKPESMELCFAGEGDYRVLLDTENANRPGDLTDMQGKIIGKHKGIANYTIGQRRGLRFAGGKPLYVGRIDPATNTVALGTREELCRRAVSAKDVNILIPEKLSQGACLFGKVRSYNDPQPCKVIRATQTQFEVEFDEAQFAPCPGQKLVLYDKNDNVVAGGTIV
jgi:tRNA-specific 2-thiouridylase